MDVFFRDGDGRRCRLHEFLKALLLGVEIYSSRFESACDQSIYVLSSLNYLTPLSLAVRGNYSTAK